MGSGRRAKEVDDGGSIDWKRVWEIIRYSWVLVEYWFAEESFEVDSISGFELSNGDSG